MAQKLAFYACHKSLKDKEEGKPVVNFDEGKGILKFAARMGNKDRGMIFDVVMLKADDLTAALISDGQAFVGEGLLKKNPREKDGKSWENPSFVMFNDEENPPLNIVDKLGKDTPTVVDSFVNFVSEPNAAGWVNVILALPAGKDENGNYVTTRVDGSYKKDSLSLEKGKRYSLTVSLFVESYKDKEKLKATVWEAKEVEKV